MLLTGFLFSIISNHIDLIIPCLRTCYLFRAIKLGDKEVEYNQNFRLILQTKLANPHYKPEMQAQTTLINFTVTRDGLEDQLLAEVVRAERPDLEELKAQLTKQQNDFKIMLKSLEDDLLSRLSSAGENILGDTALVENLEITKRTATEIEEKVCINIISLLLSIYIKQTITLHSMRTETIKFFARIISINIKRVIKWIFFLGG